MSKKYNEQSIEVLSAIEGIRKKPTMYIGEVDSHGLFHLFKETADNAVDEFLAKRNDTIAIFIDIASGEVAVGDNGNGIPTGKHPKTKISTLETVFVNVHAGGKFGKEAYDKGSVGTHGIGITAVNALSSQLTVWSGYGNKWQAVTFEKGVTKKAIHASKPDMRGLEKHKLKGTIVRYVPDMTVFRKGSKLDWKAVATWCELSAYLNAGLHIHLKVVDGAKVINEASYHSKKGLEELVAKLNAERKVKEEALFHDRTSRYDICVSFVDDGDADFSYYTNTSFNSLGGTHERLWWENLAAAIIKFGAKDDEWELRDLQSCMTGIVNMRLVEPQFSSQTKEKLIDRRVDEADADLEKAIIKFFGRHKDLAKRISERAALNYSMRSSALNNKKLARELSKEAKSGTLLPGKLTQAPKCKPENRELFLVEGDSAAAPAKAARYDTHSQEVLTLKGKPINAAKRDSDRTYANQEVFNILLALGYNPAVKKPFEKLRVRGKVVLLADPDADGPLHYDTRVLTLDGRNPKIGDMAKQWLKDHKPIEVLSRDKKGNLVVGKATLPRVTATKSKSLVIKFDDGTKINCTHSHKWMTTEGKYVRADDLKVGDGLNSVYMENRASDGSKNREDYKCIIGEKGKHIDRSVMPLHQFVLSSVDRKAFKAYRNHNRNNAPGAQVHIHHKDQDTFNNSTDNLDLISQSEHNSIHLSALAGAYNGTDKHLADLQNFYESTAGKRHKRKTRDRLKVHNKSRINRQSTSTLNRDEEVIRLQRLGKVGKLWFTLMLKYGKVTHELWAAADAQVSVMNWKEMKQRFTKAEVMAAAAKWKERGEVYELDDNYVSPEYPTQKVTKFLRICKAAEEKYGEVNERTYNNIRKKRNVRGDPRWESGLSWTCRKPERLPSYMKANQVGNHTVVSIKEIKHDEQDFYCLTVEEHGNFMVADKDGNGICSSNSHINLLLLALFAVAMPELYDMNMIYIANAPEYMTTIKGKAYYGTKDEIMKQVPKGTKVVFQHIKGWGEVSPQVLRDVAFHPETRRIQLVAKPTQKEIQTFIKLMGPDGGDYRRDLIGINLGVA